MDNKYKYTYDRTPNYCYKNSDVLINKLNITNDLDFDKYERKLTSYRQAELDGNPIKGNFDFNYLKEIHKYLFQDIYTWAGDTRNCNIAKSDLFCLMENIEAYASTIFNNLRKDNYYFKYDYEEKINKLTELFCDINALHPFREGNGRTQRYYIEALASCIGAELDLSNISQNDMIIASHESINGDNLKMLKIFKKSSMSIDKEQQILNINKYCLPKTKEVFLNLL